jgi:hypothetical protein
MGSAPHVRGVLLIGEAGAPPTPWEVDAPGFVNARRRFESLSVHTMGRCSWGLRVCRGSKVGSIPVRCINVADEGGRLHAGRLTIQPPPSVDSSRAPVAQRIEHRPPEAGAAGSSPARRTRRSGPPPWRWPFACSPPAPQCNAAGFQILVTHQLHDDVRRPPHGPAAVANEARSECSSRAARTLPAEMRRPRHPIGSWSECPASRARPR